MKVPFDPSLYKFSEFYRNVYTKMLEDVSKTGDVSDETKRRLRAVAAFINDKYRMSKEYALIHFAGDCVNNNKRNVAWKSVDFEEVSDTSVKMTFLAPTEESCQKALKDISEVFTNSTKKKGYKLSWTALENKPYPYPQASADSLWETTLTMEKRKDGDKDSSRHGVGSQE